MQRMIMVLNRIDGSRLVDWTVFSLGAGSLGLALALTAASLVTETTARNATAPAMVQVN